MVYSSRNDQGLLSRQNSFAKCREVVAKRASVVALEQRCRGCEGDIKKLEIDIAEEKKRWGHEVLSVKRYKEAIDADAKRVMGMLPNLTCERVFDESIRGFKFELAAVVRKGKWLAKDADSAIGDYKERTSKCIGELKSRLLRIGFKGGAALFAYIQFIYEQLVKYMVIEYNHGLTHGKNKGTDGLPDHLVRWCRQLTGKKLELVESENRLAIMRAELAQLERELPPGEMVALEVMAGMRHGAVDDMWEEPHMVGLGRGF